MKVTARRVGDLLHLGFEEGEILDARNAPLVRSTALRRIDGSADVAIDMSPVEFIDSAGLGALVSIYKKVRLLHRRAVIFGVRPEVRRVMEVIKLDRIFELCPDRDAAVEALGGARASDG
jgi:anti-sigma B factor antagonist